MKAVTFLGTGKYKETTYYFGDKTASPANLFPKILCEFFQPKEILVMVTKQAKDMWFDELKSQLKPLCLEPTPVDIPEGHKVEDLWVIFGELTKHLKEKDEVIFDITHSFRTLPLLSFLAASYLRVAKNVIIKGIYYGAWEARTPQPPPDNPFSSSPTDLSPIFDLTPFIKLLDWTTATDQFIKTGDAKSLSELIQSTDGKQEKLNELALSLNSIALGLNTLRPLYVMEESAKLKRKIQAAESEIKSDLPQLIPLLERIEKDYSQFSLASPKTDQDRTNIKRLTNQLRMVEWYEKRGRWVHALSLARESIVSLVCFLLSKNALSENDRSRVEKLIKKYYSTEKVPYKADWKAAISDSLRETLHKFWGGEANRKHFGIKDSDPDLASLRNDVMHAGQVETSKPIERTIQEAQTILREFKNVVGKILTQKRVP
jgi:CRISPR-associated DxTHG motif protein